MPEQSAQKPGRIVEIKGVVIDVVFPEGLPEIYTALRIDIPEQEGQEARSIIAEVQQHLRAVSKWKTPAARSRCRSAT